jgi:hypothetical protein
MATAEQRTHERTLRLAIKALVPPIGEYGQALQAGADALARVAALEAALAGMLAALSSPEDDEGLCAAHGEEMDLCDGCLYDRQKRMVVAADAARAALGVTPDVPGGTR